MIWLFYTTLWLILFCKFQKLSWKSLLCCKALNKYSETDLTWWHLLSNTVFNKDCNIQCYRMKTEWTTSRFSLVILLRSLSDMWRPQQAWNGCRLRTCEIPARWIFPCRHLSRAPSIGAHDHSRRPIASVKSVSYAALWVSDPNPPHFPTTNRVLPLVPSHPNSQHVVIHSPFFLSAFYQSEPKSLYICSTWLLPSIWPTKCLGSMLRSIYQNNLKGDEPILLLSLMYLWFPVFVCFFSSFIRFLLFLLFNIY